MKQTFSFVRFLAVASSRLLNLTRFTALTALLFTLTGSLAKAGTWVGDTDTNWNNALNWSGDAFPNAANAVIDLNSGNIATISGTPSFTPVDILVGSTGAATGRVDHLSGTVTTGVGNWVYAGTGAATATGVYNLANTATTGGALTGFGQGSGSLTIGSTSTTSGRLNLGIGGTTSGVFNMNTTGTLTTKDTTIGILAGTNGGDGTFNMDSGTVNTGIVWAGDNNVGSQGVINLGGGAFNASNVFLGRGTGQGTMTVSGSANVTLSGALTVGYPSSTTAGTVGTLNISGGTVTTSSTTAEVRIGGTDVSGAYPGQGTLNVSGGTFNVGNILLFGRGNNNASLVTGTGNFSGGVTNIFADCVVGYAGAGNLGKMNVNGGTVNIGTTATRWLIISRYDTSKGEVNVSSGNLNLLNSTAIRFTTGNTTTVSTNVFNQTGGNVNFYSNAGTTLGGTGVLDLQQSGAAGVNNTYNLDGGTLTVPQIMSNLKTGTRTFNFNGGTLKAAGASTAFVGFTGGAGAAAANVRNNGAIIDSNGFAVTITDPLVHSSIVGDNATDGGLSKLGAGVLTLTGTNTYNGPTSIAAAGGLALNGTLGSGGGTAITSAGTFSEIASGVIAGTSSLSITGGTASIAGTNTYSGATSLSGGVTTLSGTGALNNSSGISVNGTGAKLVQTSSVAVSPAVTLGTGTIDGTGTINSVSVGAATGGVIANGNGGFNTLTIPTLTFSGAATMNLSVNSANPALNTTTLTTDASGPVTLNVYNPIWSNNSVYDVVTYSTLGGAGFSKFTLGTVSGLGARQTAVLQDSGVSVQVKISGDNPTWSGALSSEWSTATLASPKNWKSVNLGTSTDFLANDAVIFGDAATGTTSVNIVGANVVPSSVTVNNNNFAYTIGSTGGFGIAGSGVLIKDGVNLLTLGSANTYSGGTQLLNGQININNASAIGTGALTINAGYLDNTSGSPVTLSTNNAQAWNSNINFIGSNSLNLGTGNVTLSTSPVVLADGAATLTVGGSISGAFALTKVGTGTLALGGAASTFNGGVTFSAGTLAINGAAALGTGPFKIDGGTVLDNTSAGAVTLTTTNVGTWNNDVTFTGTQSLNLGNGATTLGGTGDRTVTVAANTLTVGSLSSPTLGLVKAGPGTLGLGAAGISALGGTLTVQAGKIQTGINDITTTGLAGSGTVENGSGTTRWLIVNNATANTFNGVLQDGAGTGKLGFKAYGMGKMTLTNNSNSIGDVLTVGGGAGIGNMLDLKGNLAVTKAAAAGNSAVFVSGGSIHVSSGVNFSSTGELWLANADGVFGGLTIDNGSVTVGSWLAMSRGGGNAVLNHNGGTLTVTTNNLTLGSLNGVAAGTLDTLHSVATLRGTSVTNLTNTGANQGNVYVGENTTGVLTMMDSATLNVSGPQGIQIAKQNTTNSAGVFNLLGGTVTTTSITGGTGTSTMNFNGGTVKAFANSATFINGLGNAFVRSGGLTVDVNSFTLTAPQALLAAPGSGISASGLIVSGSGYFETPVVQISGGDGVGATAVASIDSSGNLTGITITNPGRNYTTAPTFTLIGGGGTGTVTGTPAFVANTSGAVTVKGAGTLTLGGANTYTGLTSVGDSATTNITTLGITNDSGLGSTDAGTIVHGVAPGAGTVGTSLLLGTVTIPAGEGITLDTGATGQRASIRVGGTADSAVINSNITLTGSGRAQLYSEGTGASSLVVNGNISGTVGDSFSVRGGAAATATGTLNGTVSIGTAPFQKTDASAWTINSTGNTWGATTISVGTLKLGANDALPTSTGVTIGQNGQSAIFDLNGKNQTITGLAGVAGSTAISVTSSAAATLTMNNSIAQTFGTNGGIISGAIKLVKTGAGTFNLSGIHTYTGDTVVSAGKLSLTNSYLADAADVRLSTGATLDLTFTGTDTIDELYIDGVAQASGTWGAVGSGATHESALITGTGKLQVTTGGTGGTAFDTWASSKGLTTGNNGKADNPDNDGLNNLGEFAFDGDPLSGVRAGKVVAKVAQVGGVNYLTLTLPVRGSGTTFSGSTEQVSALVDGIFYHVQGTTDLTNFTATVVEVTGTDATNIQSGMPTLSSGWFYRTFRSQNPVNGNPQTFLRAKITE